MIPKKNRLNRSRVQYTLKKGGKVSCEYFNIKYLNSRSDETRFAVIISLKVSPKAVERNKLRRQIYETLSNSGINKRKPLDVVIVAKNKVLSLNYNQLQKNLISTLNKING